MTNKPTFRRLNRRDVLKLGGQAAVLGLLANALPAVARPLARPRAAPLARVVTRPRQVPAALPAPITARLAATDGYLSLPGRDPLYVFGFVRVPEGGTPESLDVYKGIVQVPAPIIAMDQDGDLTLTLTNLGLVVRPDLDDSHTIHWHGFRNPNAIFDGVPEVSIAVPVGRDFPYFYRPHDPGTYMYHCHFEDTEHVQMQMTGIVYLRPSQNGTALGGYTQFAYNDGDGSTGYDRDFTLLLHDIDPNPHDLLELVQEFVWSDYKASYWVINGRAYPDTLAPNNDPALPNQPLSALVQVNEGERALLRFANLGYEQQSMQLLGIPMKVVGEDATLLRGPGGADLTYATTHVYIGPGEARDVLFTAPAYDSGAALSDSAGSYNRYVLKNRSVHRLTNGGAPGLGGQITEVRVYPAGTLAAQTHPNQTYPEFTAAAPYLDPWIV